MGAALEGGLHRRRHVLRLRLLLVGAGGDVHVDARPDPQAGGRARHRPPRLPAHVVGAEPLARDPVERLLPRVLLEPVRELQRLFRGEVREEGGVHVAGVVGHPRPRAVVVDHDLEEVGVGAEGGVVLLRPVERGEGVVVPDVPPDGLARRDGAGAGVHLTIGVAQAFVPEPLPGQDLRVVHQDAPEGDEGAVGRAPARLQLPHPALQGQKALARALGVDPLGAGRGHAMRAEAADLARPRRPAVAGPEGVVERPLALAPPHQAVRLVVAKVVLDEGEPELAGIRVAQADAGGGPAVRVGLHRLVQAGHLLPEDVLEPGDDLHSAAVRGRDHVGEDVVAGMVGGLLGGDARPAIQLGVWGGEIAPAEAVVVFLRPVVGQRAAPGLAAGDPAAIGERGHEQRVHASHLPQTVDHLLRPLVHEGDGAYLDPHHRGLGGAQGHGAQSGGSRREGRGFEERPPTDHHHLPS